MPLHDGLYTRVKFSTNEHTDQMGERGQYVIGAASDDDCAFILLGKLLDDLGLHCKQLIVQRDMETVHPVMVYR